MALYSSEQYLKPLQGVVVPRIIGVHILPGAVSIAMELPHQSFWMEASHTMPDVLKERAMEGLEMLHSRGILHGDIELRHILVGGDGAVTFIDFQLSRTTTPDDSIGLEKAEDEEFRFEKRMLAFKLDLHDARTREIQKTEGFVQRTKRNKERRELLKLRARGARTGYISPYEEEPMDEKIVPPVHPHDLEHTWIKNSDAPPARIIVPGQSEEEVKAGIQTFLESLAETRPDQDLSQPLPSVEGLEEVSEAGPSTSVVPTSIDLLPSTVRESSPSSLKRKRSGAPSPSPHGSLASFDTQPVKRFRHDKEPSSSTSAPYNNDPQSASPWTNPRDRVHMWYSDLPEDAEVPTPPPRVRPLSEAAARIREENIALCREDGLPHPELVEKGEVVLTNAQRHRLSLRKRRGIARGTLLRERDRDGYSQYVHHIEKSHQRERYLGLKHLKNAYIATCAGAPNLSGISMKEGDRTLVALLHMNERKDIPEGPRILQQAEYEHIQNTRKQAIILAPCRKLLKRRRDDDATQSFLPSENSPNPAVPAATTSATSNTIPPPRKKARTTGRSNKPSLTLSPLLQSPDPESSKTGNQAANVMPSHASHLAEHCSHACPESGIDFTPPSWRGLSLWMGSVMSWSY
jgi:tRNA A-37 threonylcarbamoyl transferase component Bud32